MMLIWYILLSSLEEMIKLLWLTQTSLSGGWNEQWLIFLLAWYEGINSPLQSWQNKAPRGELIQNYHIFTYNQYRSVTVVPHFSSRQLSGENDMWLFPGKGPSQRLGDGNGIFNKQPGKLLIIELFPQLQFPCPESHSFPTSLLICDREGKNMKFVLTLTIWHFFNKVLLGFVFSLWL